MSSTTMKPPNVAIYAVGAAFESLRAFLWRCLGTERYALIRLCDRKVAHEPWSDNVELLVVASGGVEPMPSATRRHFHKHWSDGRKLLDIGSNFVATLVMPDIATRLTMIEDRSAAGRLLLPDRIYDINSAAAVRCILAAASGTAIVGAVTSPGGGTAVFTQALLDDGDDEGQVEFWRDVLTTYLGLDCERKSSAPSDDTTVHLLSSSEDRRRDFLESLSRSGTSLTPSLLVDRVAPPGGFNSAAYFARLGTRHLGRVVLYADVLPTTMDLLDSCSTQHGVAVVARRQTRGRGRSGNCWLSPSGCAMFSVHLHFATGSRLGRRPAFVQHLASMAMVLGIRSLPGYEDLDLRLKWPNDVYSGGVKVGGLVVQSSVAAEDIRCVIGCGLNVSNGTPTTCVNDIVRKQQKPTLAPEECIALTLTQLEDLVEQFQVAGPDVVLSRYYDLWLHRDAEVSVAGEHGVIVGLDPDGFLSVRVDGRGRLVSVQPDGNSFDMLRNVILLGPAAGVTRE